MKLRNTITYVSVVRPGNDVQNTTGYLKTNCSDGSVLINFYDWFLPISSMLSIQGGKNDWEIGSMYIPEGKMLVVQNEILRRY